MLLSADEFFDAMMIKVLHLIHHDLCKPSDSSATTLPQALAQALEACACARDHMVACGSTGAVFFLQTNQPRKSQGLHGSAAVVLTHACAMTYLQGAVLALQLQPSTIDTAPSYSC
jgi:hypothetical protein